MYNFQLQHGHLGPFNTNLSYANTDGNRPGKVREVMNSDGTIRYDVWLYNGTGGALTAGAPYLVKPSVAVATVLRVTGAPATRTFDAWTVFPLTALADATWGWFAFAGTVLDLILINGAGIAIGDPLEVINGAAELIEDAAFSALTVGIALEAGSGAAVARDVFLLGKMHQVAAS